MKVGGQPAQGAIIVELALAIDDFGTSLNLMAFGVYNKRHGIEGIGPDATIARVSPCQEWGR